MQGAPIELRFAPELSSQYGIEHLVAVANFKPFEQWLHALEAQGRIRVKACPGPSGGRRGDCPWTSGHRRYMGPLVKRIFFGALCWKRNPQLQFPVLFKDFKMILKPHLANHQG